MSHYCKSPWMSLFVYNDGKVKSCCAGKWDWGDLKENTLDEIINDPKVVQLKQDILDGVPNSYCNYCSECEINSGHSQRGYFDKFDVKEENLKDTEYFGLMMTDIRWNNLCNLNCAYCDEFWSTSWQKLKGNIPIKSIKSRYYDSVLERVQQNRDMMQSIIMGGGEPLLHKQNVELLQSLNDDIMIDIMTNLSMDLGSSSVFAELSKKTNVNWCISLENIGDEFEFVRHGAKWDQMLHNISVIKSNSTHRAMFKPTYNIMSATRLDKLYELAEQFSLPVHWQTLIHPIHLCVAEMPKSIIEKCLNHLVNFKQSDLWKRYESSHKEQPGLNFFDAVIEELQARLADSNHNTDKAVADFKEWLHLYETKYATDVKKFVELWPEFKELIGDN